MVNPTPVDEPHALTGDALLAVLSALASPHRLRILAVLNDGRQYVSELARQLGISRPLLHIHLQKLQAAGLVSGSLELSRDGKAMKYFEIDPFVLHLTPALIAEAVRSMTAAGEAPADRISRDA